MSEQKKHSKPETKKQDVALSDLKPEKDTKGGNAGGAHASHKKAQPYRPPKGHGGW